jgi:O-antigen/teichoic acid export membrane protein
MPVGVVADMQPSTSQSHLDMPVKDLKGRALRGGLAKGGAQASNFLLRIGCLMVLARLLEPADFGLVGMVTAITGVLSLFREFGLSTATIQRATITDEQTSTLFWVNIAIGAALGLTSVAAAPSIAAFYHEPQLVLVMSVLGTGFIFNAAGVQHSALLQRQMQFTALAVIEVLSLFISCAISIVMAVRGHGYWSLVAWSVTFPLVSTILTWIKSGWVPGGPRLNSGIRSMVRFGGIVTLNNLVIYTAYNLDKVLLGRFWGAEVMGLYGRAYQLITLPTDQINGTTGSIAIPVLSRLQDDPQRLRTYFLKGYSLVLALTVPIAVACALFADELILIMFGPKWNDAAPIFRLLAPTVLVFALINPTGWLLVSLGMVGRSLRIALAIAPVVITGYLLGLPYGAKGVALGYSIAMAAWLVPHLLWCFHGTVVSFRDALLVVSRPLISGIVGGACALGASLLIGPAAPAIVTLLIGCTVLATVYAWFLLFVMGQRTLYLDFVHGLKAH